MRQEALDLALNVDATNVWQSGNYCCSFITRFLQQVHGRPFNPPNRRSRNSGRDQPYLADLKKKFCADNALLPAR